MKLTKYEVKEPLGIIKTFIDKGCFIYLSGEYPTPNSYQKYSTDIFFNGVCVGVETEEYMHKNIYPYIQKAK